MQPVSRDKLNQYSKLKITPQVKEEALASLSSKFWVKLNVQDQHKLLELCAEFKQTRNLFNLNQQEQSQKLEKLVAEVELIIGRYPTILGSNLTPDEKNAMKDSIINNLFIIIKNENHLVSRRVTASLAGLYFMNVTDEPKIDYFETHALYRKNSNNNIDHFLDQVNGDYGNTDGIYKRLFNSFIKCGQEDKLKIIRWMTGLGVWTYQYSRGDCENLWFILEAFTYNLEKSSHIPKDVIKNLYVWVSEQLEDYPKNLQKYKRLDIKSSYDSMRKLLLTKLICIAVSAEDLEECKKNMADDIIIYKLYDNNDILDNLGKLTFEKLKHELLCAWLEKLSEGFHQYHARKNAILIGYYDRQQRLQDAILKIIEIWQPDDFKDRNNIMVQNMFLSKIEGFNGDKLEKTTNLIMADKLGAWTDVLCRLLNINQCHKDKTQAVILAIISKKGEADFYADNSEVVNNFISKIESFYSNTLKQITELITTDKLGAWTKVLELLIKVDDLACSPNTQAVILAIMAKGVADFGNHDDNIVNNFISKIESFNSNNLEKITDLIMANKLGAWEVVLGRLLNANAYDKGKTQAVILAIMAKGVADFDNHDDNIVNIVKSFISKIESFNSNNLEKIVELITTDKLGAWTKVLELLIKVDDLACSPKTKQVILAIISKKGGADFYANNSEIVKNFINKIEPFSINNLKQITKLIMTDKLGAWTDVLKLLINVPDLACSPNTQAVILAIISKNGGADFYAHNSEIVNNVINKIELFASGGNERQLFELVLNNKLGALPDVLANLDNKNVVRVISWLRTLKLSNAHQLLQLILVFSKLSLSSNLQDQLNQLRETLMENLLKLVEDKLAGFNENKKLIAINSLREAVNANKQGYVLYKIPRFLAELLEYDIELTEKMIGIIQAQSYSDKLISILPNNHQEWNSLPLVDFLDDIEIEFNSGKGINTKSINVGIEKFNVEKMKQNDHKIEGNFREIGGVTVYALARSLGANGELILPKSFKEDIEKLKNISQNNRHIEDVVFLNRLEQSFLPVSEPVVPIKLSNAQKEWVKEGLWGGIAVTHKYNQSGLVYNINSHLINNSIRANLSVGTVRNLDKKLYWSKNEEKLQMAVIVDKNQVDYLNEIVDGGNTVNRLFPPLFETDSKPNSKSGYQTYVLFRGEHSSKTYSLDKGTKSTGEERKYDEKDILGKHLGKRKVGKKIVHEGLFVPKGDYIKGVIVDFSFKSYDEVDYYLSFYKLEIADLIAQFPGKKVYVLYKKQPKGLRLHQINIEEMVSANQQLIPQPMLNILEEYYKHKSYTQEFDSRDSGNNGIKLHTEAVIRNFRLNFSDDFEKNTGVTPEFMEQILAWHDIGKGMDRNKDKQHANSKDVIKLYRDKVGVTPEGSRIIAAIIAQDPIGEFLQPKITLEEAGIILNNSYLKVRQYWPHTTRAQYFELMKVYYLCDATSYLPLRNPQKGIIKVDNKRIIFSDKSTQALVNLKNEFFNCETLFTADKAISYYHDDHLLVRDFTKWLSKTSAKFPPNSVAIFDVDGTIVEYKRNHVDAKPHMVTIMQQLRKKGVKIGLLTNRSDTQFANGEEQKIIDGLKVKGVDIQEFIHNNNERKTEGYKNFKQEILKNYPNIVCSFGDKLNDLHRYHMTNQEYNPEFKSRSFWVHYRKQHN